MRTGLQLALGLLLIAAPLRGEIAKGRYSPLRSRFWRPLTYDENTVLLYPLDEAAAEADPDALPHTPDIADELILSDLDIGDDAVATREVRSAMSVGRPAVLHGNCESVDGGRFGGCVRFDGTDGMLVAETDYNHASTTVEFWLRFPGYPEAESITLLHAAPYVRFPSAAAVVYAQVRLTPDGALELVWNGEPAGRTDPCIAPQRWSHLALQTHVNWRTRSTARLILNGTVMREWDDLRFVTGGRQRRASFVFGNDPQGHSGLTGRIDDIRVSHKLLDYYAYTADRFSADADALNQAGPPRFRAASDFLFHLPLNGDLVPRVCTEGTRIRQTLPKTRNELGLVDRLPREHFGPGIENRALRQGTGALRPEYAGEGNIFSDRGTIAFWMQPLDWDNYTREDKFDGKPPLIVHLFSIYGEYAPEDPRREHRKEGSLYDFVILQNPSPYVSKLVDFAPGHWTHITITWQGNDFRYYVNGRHWPHRGSWAPYIVPWNRYTVYWAGSKPDRISFARHPYEPENVPMTLIDDFRVYRVALPPAEVHNLAALADPDLEPEPLPDVSIATDFNGLIGRLQTRLQVNVDAFRDAAKAEITVHDEARGADLIVTNAALDSAASAWIDLRTRPFDFGTYTVRAVIRNSEGEVLVRGSEPFERTPPPWYGKNIGVSDRVLPDWSPLRVEGSVIFPILRELHMDPSGFPRRILSAGGPVLAGPVSVEAEAGGKTVALQPDPDGFRVEDARETVVTGVGTLSAPDWKLTVHSRTEFDGMMWLEAGLEPRPGATPTLDRLSIRIPFAADSARYLNYWSGRREINELWRKQIHGRLKTFKVSYIDAVPPGHGTVFRSNDRDMVSPAENLRGSFIPYVMISGDERGMCWFAENDRGWTPDEEHPAVAIERAGDGTVTLVLNIVSRTITLSTERRFAFGLLPIPVKPPPERWRMWRGGMGCSASSTLGVSIDELRIADYKGSAAMHTFYPEDGDWDSVRQRLLGRGCYANRSMLRRFEQAVADFRKEHGREPEIGEVGGFGPWWNLSGIGIIPEHSREWIPVWDGRTSGDRVYHTAEFIDYVSWAWDQWLKHSDVNAVYLDCTALRGQRGADGPVAYRLPDGHVQPGFQWRGYRERMKRMRQVFIDNGMPPRMCAHTTWHHFIPYFSFVDHMLEGEGPYSSIPSQHDFIDHWSLAHGRFMNGKKFGLKIAWLGWTGGEAPPAKAWRHRQDRARTAYLAIHDIDWNLKNYDTSVIDAFGLRKPDTEFLSYWDEHGLARHAHGPDLKVVAWKRPGKCMVMLANVGDERIEARVTLDPAVMGFGDTPPDHLRVRDPDPTLIRRFGEDPTTIATPTELTLATGATLEIESLDDPGLSLEESPEAAAEDESQDPDAAYAWENGVLEAPVRRHDYRVFVFQLATASAAGTPARR